MTLKDRHFLEKIEAIRKLKGLSSQGATMKYIFADWYGNLTPEQKEEIETTIVEYQMFEQERPSEKTIPKQKKERPSALII